MTVEHLTNLDDLRVAAYRHVSDAELLRSRGWFVAEGRLVVSRVIDARADAVQSVLVNAAAYRSLEPQLAALHPRVPVWICEAPDFVRLTGYHLHRGCLALVERPAARSLRELLTLITRRSVATLIVLESVTNADNVGGVFRNAAAFGAAGVLLDPASCDPLYRKSIRTSMAAALEIPFARTDRWPDALDDIRAAGFTVVALTPRQPSVELDHFVRSQHARQIALLVGSEGSGLTPGAAAAADMRVRIPIAPTVDSLNLAVAVGIALSRLGDMREHSDPFYRVLPGL